MKPSSGVRAVIALAALAGSVVPARAQHPQPSAESLQRMRAALEGPHPLSDDGMSVVTPNQPVERRWGIMTLTQPAVPGEFLRISVPIGDLMSRAARSIGAAQHRRARRAADAEVVTALTEFQKAHAASK